MIKNKAILKLLWNEISRSRYFMKNIKAINDFVIKFANVNGTGSSSANQLFAKAIFRMGVPVSSRSIFPSNIQGLPTWHEIRINNQGYLGRKADIDIAVCLNTQSMQDDLVEVKAGGFFIYDSTEPFVCADKRSDISFIGIPFARLCNKKFTDARQRILLKNMVYVGAVAALVQLDFSVFNSLVNEQFAADLALLNMQALELGYQYTIENCSHPLSIHLECDHNINDQFFGLNHILMDGNTALALGAIYGGATVAAWYPITPSTSVVEQFEKYASKLRVDKATGKNNYAVLQMEDEMAALGVVIGASWNGARAFAATSGPGLSLMNELLGLAYFAEIPVVLIDVQRAGPSTGMPTKTQQSDIISAAYASHGDTKHVLLFPSTVNECFSMAAHAFDLAERLQTPVIILSDLELGMNMHFSAALEWDEHIEYDRGKVLSAAALEQMSNNFGRYMDVDGDAIPYRTYPGTHKEKGAFFTRGSSKNEFANYTENGAAYAKNMHRLSAKFETAKTYMPAPKIKQNKQPNAIGAVFFGSSLAASYEAIDTLQNTNISIDSMCVLAFPFNDDVEQFIAQHQTIFVIEQNRDGQMRHLLIQGCEITPTKLVSILHFDGLPITASFIVTAIMEFIDNLKVQQNIAIGGA